MSLFNSEQFGKDPRFWMGQIVDDSEWKENRLGEKYTSPSDVPGWGYRYKVRIFGKHPETGLQDVELPWADVLYPVTGGSGHASSFQTPNLRKNSFVFGIYLDGMDETQPCIFGCFGNNDQTKLLFSRPTKGFTPASALYGGENAPVFSISKSQGPLIESVGLGENIETESDEQADGDGLQKASLPVSEKCAKSLDDTQIELKKFIQRVEETQRRAQNWSYWVNARGTELASGVFRTETIDIDIQRTAEFISGKIKDIINGIRQFVTEKIDDIISDTYKLFFPEEEKEVEEAHNQAIDLITCLFNKIIANLIKMIGDLLRELVNRFINVPLCAVENILSGLLGQLLGLITGTLNSIFGPLSALIGSAIDLAGDILGFVGQILGFFLCDEDSACPESTEWSSWGGAGGGKASLDFNKIFNKTKEISENAKRVVDPNNFDFNLDFSSVFQDTCNVGPVFCGPPTVEFFGGKGKGARGNAIVSAAGSILGVDIITPGGGYSTPPKVKFVDACGVGRGAKGRARIKDGKVTQIIIDKSGSKYKPNFDGSRGGDGRVYAKPEQIVIKRSNGKYDQPYNPGEPFDIFEGDEVSGPFDPTVTLGLLGGTGGSSGDTDDDIELSAGGTGGDEVNVDGNTAIAGDLIVTIGGTGGTTITAGGSGGTPVTIGGIPVISGGVGGTPIFVNGNQVTSGGLPVTIGGIGGLSVTAGATGGTPVIIQNPSLSAGGTGGTPLIIDGRPVNAGGTGGIPLTVNGNPVDAGGRPVNIGGTGGTPVNSGAIGGTPLTINGRPVTINDFDVTTLGQYPVVLKLCEIEIQSTGVNYSPNDTIVVEPSNGAILEPVFGPFGSIIDVNIIDEGEGFTERPNIVIKTETGYNAILIPILCVNRIGDIPEELYTIPEGEQIIKVIDCVGKP